MTDEEKQVAEEYFRIAREVREARDRADKLFRACAEARAHLDEVHERLREVTRRLRDVGAWEAP